MQVRVPALDVQQANLQTIDIGTAKIGPITVGDLVVDGTDLTFSATHAVLHDMSLDVILQISIEWHVGFSINDIVHINEGSTVPIADIPFHLPASLLGDVDVGPLTNVKLNIPVLTASNLSVDADPLGLRLTNAAAEQIHAQNVALPVSGFSIAGLSLNSVAGSAVTVPDARLDAATVGHVHGDPVAIPVFGLSNLNLPQGHADLITNDTPLNIPLTLEGPTNPPGIDFDIGYIVLHITTKVNAHIPHLVISGVDLNAGVGQIHLHNVTLPYDVLNLTLSQVGINSIAIPAFNVS